jgi:hypothetical protein
MSPLPTIGFDTSAINALENEGLLSDPLMAGLEAGFRVLLLGLSAEEVISTRKEARRQALLSRIKRLLRSGECLWPPHEITRLQVEAHFRSPSAFDWTRVSARARPYEEGLTAQDFPPELCLEQRSEQSKAIENFENLWTALRPKLDAVIAQGAKRPQSFAEAMKEVATVDGGLFWHVARGLYERVTRTPVNDVQLRAFVGACPPFRAVCYAMMMAWYNFALKLREPTEPSPPGRNDLLMAVYLPYCGRFVAKDWPQERDLRLIAEEARIDCEVVSLDDFSAGFSPMGVLARSCTSSVD